MPIQTVNNISFGMKIPNVARFLKPFEPYNVTDITLSQDGTQLVKETFRVYPPLKFDNALALSKKCVQEQIMGSWIKYYQLPKLLQSLFKLFLSNK